MPMESITLWCILLIDGWMSPPIAPTFFLLAVSRCCVNGKIFVILVDR